MKKFISITTCLIIVTTILYSFNNYNNKKAILSLKDYHIHTLSDYNPAKFELAKDMDLITESRYFCKQYKNLLHIRGMPEICICFSSRFNQVPELFEKFRSIFLTVRNLPNLYHQQSPATEPIHNLEAERIRLLMQDDDIKYIENIFMSCMER